MPLYDFGCTCGEVTERKAGYEVTVIPCPSCGKDAQRLAVYAYQSIRGDTVPTGNATRAGNVKSPKGKYRVSLFQEACAEVAYDSGKREEAGLVPAPNLYKVGIEEARRRGAPIRANS